MLLLVKVVVTKKAKCDSKYVRTIGTLIPKKNIHWDKNLVIRNLNNSNLMYCNLICCET